MSDANRIAIACVQAKVTLPDYYTEESFRSMTERLVQQAAATMPEGVPRLIVFPEDYASGCLFAGEEAALKDASSLRGARSEEHTSELQSRENLVCRLLLEKKKV